MVKTQNFSTKSMNVLFQLAFFILIVVIGNCRSATNHYYVNGQNDALSSFQSIQSSGNGGLTFTSLGNTITAEPGYDRKCKEENTDKIEVCARFSIGDENQGFIYSLNFPNNYPNSTECTRCIEAPHGRFIKLEFRDNFNMEESASCEYDKLEIRNGPKPLPPADCSDDIIGHSSGFISQENISAENIIYSSDHNAPLECVWTITVEEKNKMYVNFIQYILEKPNDCSMNYIDIYEDNFNEEKRKQRFCGTSTEPFKSDGNTVRIRFHAKPGALKAKFSLLYTSFRETQNKEKCNPTTEFDCNDGTCINIALKCNDQHNCKYRYDEDKSLCQQDGSGLASLADNHMIVILVVFFALVIGMCASIIVSCWGKIQERRQRELDYKMRVSSHPSLDAIDRINLVYSSKQQLPTSGYSAAQQMLNARYKQQLLMGSRNNSEEADADAMLDSLAKEEPDDEEACYLPEMDGSLLVLDESNSYSDQPHTHPAALTSTRHLRGPPIVQHSLTSQNTDLVSPTDSCPLFYLHRPGTAGSVPLTHHLLQQASQTQTESLKSGSNESEDSGSIPPAPPPPKISNINRGLSDLSREYNLRQRQTPIQQLPTSSLLHTSPGSQPNLNKLVDNQIAAAFAHHLPHQTHHYLPNHYNRAISPTILADDLAYHQHALHGAASHPHLHHQTSTGGREMLHLSQHSLNHPITLQQAQYNSSKQRLIQSHQSSQQSDSPGQQQQPTAQLLHHPDCAAIIRPNLVNQTNQPHFYTTSHTPSHKQTKQLLDDSIDIQQFTNSSRQQPQTSTMHNQTPPLFGMSRPSNLINSSQDEECESEMSNQPQNGQLMNRGDLDFDEENDVMIEEDELIEDEPQQTQQQMINQQQQQQQQLQQQLIRNRPQFRQLSSNSNNDSNESAVNQSPIQIAHHNPSGGEDKKHLVPLTNNRLQQQIINKNNGSKLNDTNSSLGGQQSTSISNNMTGGGIGQLLANNSNLMPSQQQQILQRNFVVENRQNSTMLTPLSLRIQIPTQFKKKEAQISKFVFFFLFCFLIHFFVVFFCLAFFRKMNEKFKLSSFYRKKIFVFL